MLAPPPPLGPIQLMHSLDFDYEFQIQAPDIVSGRYRLVIATASTRDIIYDISRDICGAEPYSHIGLHIRGEPVFRAPARPYRIHVQRLTDNNIDWETVSNTITQQ